MGGSHAVGRHSFGVGQKAAPEPRKPRFIPAPEKRNLGLGMPAKYELSQAQLQEIQSKIAPIIEALRYELEAIKIESDMVSGQSLRVEPDLYKSIPLIGPYFTPQEVRSAILVSSGELGTAASRILTGSLAGYLSAEQKQALEAIVADTKAMTAYIQQFDMTPLTGASSKLAQDYVENHVAAAVADLKDIEKGIVTTEAAGINVREPMEKGIGLGGLLAVGALIAVGIVIADLI